MTVTNTCVHHRLRQKVYDALQGNDIGSIMDPTKFSRNYKIGSVEGNMIFEGNSYLPKEVMLDMTLRAFGFEIDMMEVKNNIYNLICAMRLLFIVVTVKV